MIRSRVRGDAGFSVVELSVTMVVTGLLLAAVSGFAISTLDATRQMGNRLSRSADARLGMEAVTRTVRLATAPTGASAALERATTTELTFYATLDRSTALVVGGAIVPSKVEYYRSGGCLYEAFTPARVSGTGYAWDTGRTARCLIRTDATTAMFRYYTSGSSSTALTVPGTGLVPAVLPTVQSIGIDLDVVDADDDAGSAGTSTRVTMTNVVLTAGGTG